MKVISKANQIDISLAAGDILIEMHDKDEGVIAVWFPIELYQQVCAGINEAAAAASESKRTR